jgi:SAM-dependent methyltransferase
VEFFGPIAESLLHAMPPVPGERWLDMGCGRGAVLLRAAEAAGPSGRVTGIDVSPAMVGLAREAADLAGLTNVRIEQGDAQAPAIDEADVDAIASCLVLFFLADPSEALRAWIRLLAPGGRIGLTTFGPQDARWRLVDAVFQPYLPAGMKDARTSGAAGPFASDEGVERLLTEAGFVDVRTEVASVPVHFANPAQWHAFSWSIGQRAMWLAVPEEERPAVRAEAERRLAEHAGADGSVTLEQPIRHTLGRRPG